MSWPDTHSTNVNGPVPTGVLLKSMSVEFGSMYIVFELRQHRRVRVAQHELHGRIVDDVHVVDGGEVRAARRAEVLVHDLVEGELDVLGLEVFAVVELDALAQVEGIGQAVLRDVPRFGQARHDAIERARLAATRPSYIWV